MAKDCPKDLVRALVEGTLDGQSGLRDEALGHLDACASCRKLRSKLERQERQVRAAIEEAGELGEDETDEGCPTPAELAAWTERALAGEAYTKIEDHVARCGLCRGSSAIAAQPLVEDVSDEAFALIRKRLDAVRSPGEAEAEPVKRTQSGRRRSPRTTGRYAAVTAMPVSGVGTALWIAAAAAVLVGIGLAAFHETTTSPDGNIAKRNDLPAPPPRDPVVPPSTEKKTETAPRPETTSPETPVQGTGETPRPSTDSPVIARNPTVEPEPEEDDGRHAVGPRGVGAPSTGEAPKTTSPGETPRDRLVLDPKRPTNEPVLACAVADLTGPAEIRKKDAKLWRALVASEAVSVGDSLRAKAQDCAFTFAARARVQLDGDTAASVAYTPTGVQVTLESGGLEGESLARDGLVVKSAHGTITVWNGSKVRIEATESGVRLVVDKGRAKVENELGKVMVKEGQETSMSKDGKPHPPLAQKGPRRSTSRSK